MALTLDIVWQAAQRQKRRQPEESLEDYAGRLTHLNLSRRRLARLVNLQYCQKLIMLSLYDNRIAKLQSLQACSQLTQLHIQNNRITRLEGLGRLRSLTKLFIGHNEIIVVEGLHTLQNLKELRIENQRLPPGERLIFDPRTLVALRKTLTVLNLAGNRLEDLSDLGMLQNVEDLNVSNNELDDLKDLLFFMGHNGALKKLKVSGNPFCMLYKYREERREEMYRLGSQRQNAVLLESVAEAPRLRPRRRSCQNIISSSHHLAELDGEEVSPTMRSFLMSWKSARQKRGGLPPPRPREPVDPYKPATFKRQGVTLAPTFPNRLRGAPRNLPPLSSAPMPTSGRGSATVKP